MVELTPLQILQCRWPADPRVQTRCLKTVAYFITFFTLMKHGGTGFRGLVTGLATLPQAVMLTRTGHARTRTRTRTWLTRTRTRTRTRLARTSTRTRTRTWLTRTRTRTRTSLTVTYCKLQLNVQSLSSKNNELGLRYPSNLWLEYSTSSLTSTRVFAYDRKHIRNRQTCACAVPWISKVNSM